MRISTRKEAERERLLEKLESGIRPVSDDRARFDAACENFRFVCSQIGELIGKEFKGGYDDISTAAEYIYAQDLDTEQGKRNAIRANSLMAAWSGANDFCIYEGKRIGLGQPEWWKECWKASEEQ